MRVRDIIIIGVAFVCSIICWSQEGSLNFQRGFKVAIADNELTDTLMPKPLVVDPDGSGSRFLLASVTSDRLSKFSTHYARRRIDSAFVNLVPIAELSVNAPILAIGAGYTSPESKVMLGAVLTDDFKLTGVFIDGDGLDVKWKSQVVPSDYWKSATQASISIIPESAWKGDSGIVAVAVGVTDSTSAEMTLYAAFDAETGALRWRYFSDGGNEMDDVVREAASNTSFVAVDGEKVVLPVGEAQKEDEERRTTFHGKTYEQPWSTFREGVIAAMPHRFAHPWDVQLYPHTFYRVKSGKKARQSRRQGGNRVTLRYNDRVVHMETDDYGTFGDKLNSFLHAAESKARLSPSKNETRRRRSPNVFVYHGRYGVEVVHIYTGYTVTTIGPLKSDGTAYHDINDDLMLESASTQIGPRTAIHSKHGVDLMYDCLGLIEAGAPASTSEVFNATVCDTQGFFGNLDLIHHFVDGDVRGEEAPHAVNTLELLGSRNIASATTGATPPLIVQVQSNRGGGVYQVERYAVFMINSGLVTCIDPSRRRVLWRAQTGSRFSAADDDEVANLQDDLNYEIDEVRPFPQLVSYSLSQKSRETDVTFVGGGKELFRRVDTYVLAVGDTEFSIIKTKNGKVTRSIALTEAPVAPVLVVDFNGDGVNDLIIVSRYNIYGFIGISQASSETTAVLMVLLVGLLGILFAVREKNIAEGGEEDYSLPVHSGDKVQRAKTFKRSTD